MREETKGRASFRPSLRLVQAPLPVPSLEELALQPGVDEVLRLAALSPHAPSSWSPSLRQRIVFELGKRGKLDQRVRDFFSLGPPPPPIEVDCTPRLPSAGAALTDLLAFRMTWRSSRSRRAPR